jgi:NitT/TauT family transport system ATP-binding protein
MTTANGTAQATGVSGSRIEVRDVRHVFDVPGRGETVAVDAASFSVGEGEFVAVVGPSGCGKTTVLNMIAGLIAPSSGTVTIDGKPVDGIRPDIGYMFARDGLLPWRTAQANVEFGMELRGVRKEVRRSQARALLRMVGLAGFETHLRSELSHGMRQRVGLARTLATDPRILLMDEPFGALDAQTKLILEDEFLRIWERDRKSVVFVTHDLVEAVGMADRVLVFSARPGRIKGDFYIDLPRPRHISEMRFGPEFEKIYAQIWECLRSEVTRFS